MDAEKALLGGSLPLYEVEEDFDRDITEEASLKYDMMSVISAIGTDDFKSTYVVLMSHIAEQSIEIQRPFCYEIATKVEQIYGYDFPVNLDFVGEYSVFDFYKFLEFLEFDYIDFLSKLWKLLPVSLKTIDIASYCNSEYKLVISRVEQVVQSEIFSKLVSIFLRTYMKEDMIKFIIEKTYKERMMIILKIKTVEDDNL